MSERKEGYKRRRDRKSEQLGIPWATAHSRLQRNLLFYLIQEANKDKCYRCGEAIEDIKSKQKRNQKKYYCSRNCYKRPPK